jgi:DAK2 domain
MSLGHASRNGWHLVNVLCEVCRNRFVFWQLRRAGKTLARMPCDHQSKSDDCDTRIQAKHLAHCQPSNGFLLNCRSGATDKGAWAAAARAGVDAVQRYGGAGGGDRTMLDALLPAIENLELAAGDCEFQGLELLLRGLTSGA